MGKDLDSKRGRSKKRSETTSSSDSESPSPNKRRKSRRSTSKRDRSRDRARHRSAENEKSSRQNKRGREKEERSRRKRRHRNRSPSITGSSSDNSGGETEPNTLVRGILGRYPQVAGDLKQLLQIIDDGQGVDVKGIPNKELVELLKELFSSLKLKRSDNGVFLLPPRVLPTLEVVGSTLASHLEPTPKPGPSEPSEELQSVKDDNGMEDARPVIEKRFIGPAMPSRELLDAAAKLTEAETIFREAEMDGDGDHDGLIIGPPPPAVVAEAESANEAERFEEVARIAGAEVDKPYDVLGVNWKMSSDNIKKKYWKLSLMVHPDKCSHPQAHQAFVILNQAFKDLQDPDKRKALDENIKRKEELDKFKAELRGLREAAQWRRLQGISMEGDDELLAFEKEAPKREEWMTILPPERKPGVTTQSTTFSKTTKEGRGDTSVWTDTPLDKTEKAKQSYLEAYNTTIALADLDDKRKGTSSEADLVDKYNSSKRSVSLMQKHQETRGRKGKSKQLGEEEWKGKHPWKPWNRENDLTAGRKRVDFDSENVAMGLSSLFSDGKVERNFL